MSSNENAITEGGCPAAGLRYVVDDLEYILSDSPAEKKHVVVTVRHKDRKTEERSTERVDVCSSHSWRRLAEDVAKTFHLPVDDVEGHRKVILDKFERATARSATPVAAVLTPARTKAAEKILAKPDVLALARTTLDRLGYVGEDAAKMLVYLVATSRLLARPLSAILMAASAAGKSELLDSVVKLMPPESVLSLSRLTPQALTYLGPDALRHKLIVVDEQAGTEGAEYSLRTLQSRGSLSVAVPGKKGKTETLEVNGPVSVLSGTTTATINDENLSRCLELTLDDSAEQTRRVQDAQRRAAAGHQPSEVDVEAWQDAQRLLEPMSVVIPFAEQLEFPDTLTKHRRDNQKLLGLVMTHALLHQRQRERDDLGRLVATAEDYAAVHALLAPIVERAVEGLSPRAADLYRILLEKKIPSVTKREAAKLLGASYMTGKRSVDELVSQELLVAVEVRRGSTVRHGLTGGAVLGDGTKLTNPDELK